MSALFAFLHHVAAFMLFAALVVEFILVKDEITLHNARRLLRVDAIFGVSAAIVLVVGILRVIYFEKGFDYYIHSVPFIAKFALFAVIGLLSIYPTLRFMSWRPAVKQGKVPAVDADTLRKLRNVLHAELAGVIVLILMAALMARGIGMLE
jgi:putative membrane protein